jgi:hypothetical protein
MASEDSDQVGSGLPAVHRLSNLDDVDQTLTGEVVASIDVPHAQSEAIEVDALCALQRERLEERNDLPKEVRPLPHDVPLDVLAMVVVAPVDQHLADPEEALELSEAASASLALHHGKLMRDLEAGSIAGSPAPRRLSDEADGEASLSVYEP